MDTTNSLTALPAHVMTNTLPDPIRKAAELISAEEADAIESRLKHDIIKSIGRIKPDVIRNLDFESDVLQGQFFAGLDAPLQGIAIAKTEGALAFYNRVGWRSAYLDTPLASLIDPEHQEPLQQRYHATTLHDLAYVHPKHVEKIFGKAGAAGFWESLKRFSDEQT